MVGLGLRAAAVAAVIALGACQTGDLASRGSPAGKAIAFDSIEGGPPLLRTAFASELAAAASNRQVALVGAGEARYRLRGYLTAEPSPDGGTALAYVWDVYDAAEKRRAQRLGGESVLTLTVASGADPWALDKEALARLASRSMDEIAGFLSASPAPTLVAAASETAPEPPQPALSFAAR